MSGYTCFAKYYDLLTQNVDYKRRAALLEHYICRHRGPGGRGLLLDLACGTGSLSLELAALGYEVIGADASAEMLSAAMSKNDRGILYLHQPAEKLDLYGTVDVTVCALDSLNHILEPKKLLEAFRRVALFTAPGGLFLFDMNTAYKHRQILGDNAFVYDLPQVYCVWQNHCRKSDARVDIALDFFEPSGGGGYRRCREHFAERIYSPRFVAGALRQNGFTLLEAADADQGTRPAKNSQRLLYVAKKQEQRNG